MQPTPTELLCHGTSKTAPNLISQRAQKLGLHVKREHCQQHQAAHRCQRNMTEGKSEVVAHVGNDVEVYVATHAVAAVGARSIAVSRTGKFTKPAKTPRAMEMYQTMS